MIHIRQKSRTAPRDGEDVQNIYTIVDTSKWEGNLEDHPCLEFHSEYFEIVDDEIPETYQLLRYSSPEAPLQNRMSVSNESTKTIQEIKNDPDTKWWMKIFPGMNPYLQHLIIGSVIFFGALLTINSVIHAFIITLILATAKEVRDQIVNKKFDILDILASIIIPLVFLLFTIIK